MNKEKLYTDPVLDKLFDNFDFSETEKDAMRMGIAIKIADAIKAKGWSKKEFALKMGKRPSEISKWLAGVHNFTIDTLFDVQKMLGIILINIDAEVPKQNLYKQYHSLKKDLSKEQITSRVEIIIGKKQAVITKSKYKINLKDQNSVNEI